MSRTTTWSRTLRRSAAAAVVPLALVSLSACGSDESADDTSSSSADSGSDTGSDTGSEGDSGSEGSTEETLAEGDEVPADEMADILSASFEDATTATFTMETGGSTAMQAEGEADFSENPYSMEMQMKAGGQDLTMVLEDNVIYMQGIAGDGWVKMDLSDPNNPFGSLMTEQMDPRTMFDSMEKGIQSATFVGTEDVEGESLDHYSIVLDGKALLENLDPEMAGLAESQMPDTIAYEIFLDDEGLFRRAEVDMGATGPMTMTYDNWGDPVDIEAPPASEVQSMEDLMGSMGGMS
jgi:hypothetical protein